MTFNEFKERWKRGPSDITGIDIGQTAIKTVRLRKSGDGVVLIGSDLQSNPAGASESLTIAIPARLRARYVSIAVSGDQATAKLLTFPGAVDSTFESGLAKTLGVSGGTDHRVAYRIITEGAGRTESRVLAIALPESAAAPIMRQFSSGLPAPYSLEIAPVAALTAYEAALAASASTAAGLLDFGTRTSTLSLFHRRNLILFRRFDFGFRKLLDRVMSTLHIDEQTALNILSDTAFDISELIGDIMGPFSSQLIVSRDFAERRENCVLRDLHLIGGISACPAATREIERALNLPTQLFNPFRIPFLNTDTPDCVPATDPWRFTAAIGAALGTLQEKP